MDQSLRERPAARADANDPYKVNSLILGPEVNPVEGTVVWDPARSLWNGAMLLGALVLGPLYFTWDAFAVFLG